MTTQNPFRSPARWAGLVIIPLLVLFVVPVVMAVTNYQTFTPEPGYIHVYTEPGWDR